VESLVVGAPLIVEDNLLGYGVLTPREMLSNMSKDPETLIPSALALRVGKLTDRAVPENGTVMETQTSIGAFGLVTTSITWV
jgi:hypothetical protein